VKGMPNMGCRNFGSGGIGNGAGKTG